jgi:GT2 family glycosyltransferase
MGETGRFVEADRSADIAVVVVTYNSASQIDHLLTDLRRDAVSLVLRVIVVDNESTDGTADLVAQHDDVNLIRSGGNLGYAGGINRGRAHLGNCTAALVLNPDLRLREGALAAMFSTLARPDVGAAVPRSVCDDADKLDLTLRREPSILGALGDALVGGRRLTGRPKWLTETELRCERYQQPHAVAWATGAAMLIRAEVERAVGNWDESFFLYSEETDYCRRIRDRGYLVWFEPKAIVQHSGAGSGTSPTLTSLMVVNRVRYVERHHGRLYAATYRGIVALCEALRARGAVHRRSLSMLLRRNRWRQLSCATGVTEELRPAGG